MCEHENFAAEVDVNRIQMEEDGAIERWAADVRIRCADCGVKMRFIGLPAGVDVNGAATSVDATEGWFAIAPEGHVLSELEGTPIGFTIRKRQ